MLVGSVMAWVVLRLGLLVEVSWCCEETCGWCGVELVWGVMRLRGE